MTKHNRRKNFIKLKLVSSKRDNSLTPVWALVSNSDYSNEERQKIENLLGGVIASDKPESDLLIEEDVNKHTQNNTENTSFSLKPLSTYTKDYYFPDDGYDYEQHLCKISNNNLIKPPNNRQNHLENRESALLSSISVLTDSNNALSHSQILSELNEIFDCFDEVSEFEELNDDFILDATGLERVEEIGKNVDIDGILWGKNNLNLSMSNGKFADVYEPSLVESNCAKLETSNSFLEISDGELSEVLAEYDQASVCSNENDTEHTIVHASQTNNIKHSHIEYKQILDNYIKQAKCEYIEKNKKEKVVDINTPLERPQIEKIISIIDKVNFDDLSEETDIETSEDNIEIALQCQSQTIQDTRNRPKKIDITEMYPGISPPAKGGKPKITKEMCDVYEYTSNYCEHSFTPSTNRNRNETSDERRERKGAFKQAKREIREIKRRNKQETKELKKSLVSNFLGRNHYDIKNGFRHFRF